jgi:amidase
LPADFDQSKDTVRINGREIRNPFLGWAMTTPFNAMSRCPVISMPSGRARNGVPTGIQIVGRSYCDADVFRAAMAFETAQGAWYRSAGLRPKL